MLGSLLTYRCRRVWCGQWDVLSIRVQLGQFLLSVDETLSCAGCLVGAACQLHQRPFASLSAAVASLEDGGDACLAVVVAVTCRRCCGGGVSVAVETDAAPHGLISIALLLGQKEHDVPAVVEVAKVVLTTTIVAR